MMRPAVRRLDASEEFATSERCAIVEVSNSADDPAMSIARARVAPGLTTRWHRLEGTAERYVILSGTGRVEVGDDLREEVREGDVVLIPPGARQRIANTGDRDLVFLAICTPRFSQDNYEELDE
ncbi:MAG: cupin domain-containing protein [Burkholderiales bacterium]